MDREENSMIEVGRNKDRKLCVKCIYRGRDRSTVNGCDYIEYVGHSRGCSVEDCDKYVNGPRINKTSRLEYENHKGESLWK